jgi:hypothetical protein
MDPEQDVAGSDVFKKAEEKRVNFKVIKSIHE